MEMIKNTGNELRDDWLVALESGDEEREKTTWAVYFDSLKKESEFEQAAKKTEITRRERK